jgi:hypothetical protein
VVAVAAFIRLRTEAMMAESTPIRIDPVTYVRSCRERGDTWEEIAATGAFVDQKTKKPLTGDQVWEWFEAQTGGNRRAVRKADHR